VNKGIKEQNMGEFFKDELQEMVKTSNVENDRVLSEANIYQEKHANNRDILFEMLKRAILPQSSIVGLENFQLLASLAEQGKSCLIFAEHLSNMDVPALYYLMRQAGSEYEEIFEKIIFIAGRKLNEASQNIKIITEMFTRIVITPLSSFKTMKKDGVRKDEVREAKKNNIKAQRLIAKLKNENRFLLVYPTGTRFRAWAPETGRGQKEVVSYLRSFDYFINIATSGNVMVPSKGSAMDGDIVIPDKIIMKVGKVIKSDDFIAQCKLDYLKQVHNQDEIDEKQFIIDQVMAEIKEIKATIEL